jgi:hypothetical protein
MEDSSGVGADARADTAPVSPSSTLDSLTRIERTQQRLWALALILFLLTCISLLAIDAASTVAERLIYGITDLARLLIDYYAVGLTFLTTVVLVCVYFREKLVQVRNENRELVRALDANARILALRNSELDTWDQLSHQLITNLNLPRLLDLIVKTAAEVTESDCAAATVVEHGSPHLRLAAIYRRGMQTELARKVAARVIATGEPVHLTPECVPPELDRPDLAWDGVAALAASPLMATESVEGVTVVHEDDHPTGSDGVLWGVRRATGCLLVGRLDPAEPYPPSILKVLGSFANQASIALEKAHLYAESQRRLQRLSKLLDELHTTQSRLGARPLLAPDAAPAADPAIAGAQPGGNRPRTVGVQ